MKVEFSKIFDGDVDAPQSPMRLRPVGEEDQEPGDGLEEIHDSPRRLLNPADKMQLQRVLCVSIAGLLAVLGFAVAVKVWPSPAPIPMLNGAPLPGFDAHGLCNFTGGGGGGGGGDAAAAGSTQSVEAGQRRALHVGGSASSS
jgi:hypothetical protein